MDELVNYMKLTGALLLLKNRKLELYSAFICLILYLVMFFIYNSIYSSNDKIRVVKRIKNLDIITSTIFSKENYDKADLIEVLNKLRTKIFFSQLHKTSEYATNFTYPIIVTENGSDIEGGKEKIVKENISNKKSIFIRDNNLLYTVPLKLEKENVYLVIPLLDETGFSNIEVNKNDIDMNNLESGINTKIFFKCLTWWNLIEALIFSSMVIIAVIFSKKYIIKKQYIHNIKMYRRLKILCNDIFEESKNKSSVVHSIRNSSIKSNQLVLNYAIKYLCLYENMYTIFRELDFDHSNCPNNKGIKQIVIFDIFKREIINIQNMVLECCELFGSDIQRLSLKPTINSMKGKGVFYTDKDYLMSLLIVAMSVVFVTSKNKSEILIDFVYKNGELFVLFTGIFSIDKKLFQYPSFIDHSISIKDRHVVLKIKLNSILNSNNINNKREDTNRRDNVVSIFGN